MMVPLFLLIAHFFGDFVLQDDWMALNKSKDLKPLLAHVGVYTLTIAVFVLGYIWTVVGYNFMDVMTILTIPELGLVNKIVGFLFLTFGSHLLVDAVTSRVNAQLWFMAPMPIDKDHFYYIPGRRHWFFVALGADQLLHFVTIAYSYAITFGR
jgi:hypothetical protein